MKINFDLLKAFSKSESFYLPEKIIIKSGSLISPLGLYNFRTDKIVLFKNSLFYYAKILLFFIKFRNFHEFNIWKYEQAQRTLLHEIGHANDPNPPSRILLFVTKILGVIPAMLVVIFCKNYLIGLMFILPLILLYSRIYRYLPWEKFADDFAQKYETELELITLSPG